MGITTMKIDYKSKGRGKDRELGFSLYLSQEDIGALPHSMIVELGHLPYGPAPMMAWFCRAVEHLAFIQRLAN